MSLYLYAILDRRPGQRGGRGLRREPLRFLRVAGLVVAAGAMSDAPSPSAAALRRHDATVRRLARTADAILPVRFGTVVPDLTDLSRQLRPRARKLRAALALVAGREQMTLRVFGSLDGRPRQPSHPAPRLRARAGRRYLAARLQAKRRAQAVPAIGPLRPALRGLVRAERIEPHGEPPLLASLYHLVDRGQAPAYRAAVTGAAPRLVGIRLRSSGPWAPYAFAPEGLG
jgi:Gas vesicle synthesis protein GvpL/GvpF